MSKFIYIFDVDDRDKMLARGYTLLKSDKKNNIYIFENKKSFKFDSNDITYILSSTLTF